MKPPTLLVYLLVVAVLSCFAFYVVQPMALGQEFWKQGERAQKRGTGTWVGREQKQEGRPQFQREDLLLGWRGGGAPGGKRLFKYEVTRGVHYDLPGAKAADWLREYKASGLLRNGSTRGRLGDRWILLQSLNLLLFRADLVIS